MDCSGVSKELEDGIYIKRKAKKQKTTSFIAATLEKQCTDLASQYTHKALSIGSDEHLLFDVPADNHCPFHSLEGVIRPLYQGSPAPAYKEIRRAVISFYRTCPNELRRLSEEEWPGVTTMEQRADILEQNPNEWGEYLDIRAAAIYYNVDLQVAAATRRGRAYVEDVHSSRRDGQRSANCWKVYQDYLL